MAVPLCKCRVLYIGSAVPTVTKDGLQGVQQPLKERYPATDAEVKGIDSWLSVWSNGVLLEYIEGNSKTEGLFHPINNLHYCAAVKYVVGSGGETDRFVPLDSPFGHESSHPPIFAAIFRRTTGVKVLECHAFICTTERAANALVRCCFHAYADTALLKIEDKLPRQKAIKNGSLSERPETPNSEQQTSEQLTTDDNRDEIDWEERAIGQKTWQRRQQSADYDEMLSNESSIHKKPGKRSKKHETKSDILENNGMIIPYNEPLRRSGSHPDISQSRPFEPHFPLHIPPQMHHFGPPLHARGRSVPHPMPHPMFVPPPHHFNGKHPMPPFHHYPGAVPPQFFGRFGGRPVPPHIHPMFLAPPQHFVGKPFYPMFMPPPPPHFGYPHQPTRPAPTGPIIESIYDTYPRRGNYDETIYMSSNGTLPPSSVYKPGSHAEHYEGFYETYKRPSKVNGVNSDSDTSVDDSQFWDTYETGAYRKVNQNEKPRNGAPKMNGEKSPSPQKAQSYGESAQSGQSHIKHSTPKVETRSKRPATPEIDYDEFGNIHVTVKTNSNHQNNRQAAVF